MNAILYPEHDQRIREGWAEGLSTAEIGRRIGRSKNAVIGRVHRMGLPSRPSPISLRNAEHPNGRNGIPSGQRRKPGALKAIREMRTLEPLAPRVEYKPPPQIGSLMAALLLPPEYKEPIEPTLARQLNAAKRVAPNPTMTPGAHVGAARTCQYPIGDPREPGFMFCGDPVERDESGAPTGSYCACHRRLCYVRTRRQEWAEEVA